MSKKIASLLKSMMALGVERIVRALEEAGVADVMINSTLYELYFTHDATTQEEVIAMLRYSCGWSRERLFVMLLKLPDYQNNRVLALGQVRLGCRYDSDMTFLKMAIHYELSDSETLPMLALPNNFSSAALTLLEAGWGQPRVMAAAFAKGLAEEMESAIREVMDKVIWSPLELVNFLKFKNVGGFEPE